MTDRKRSTGIGLALALLAATWPAATAGAAPGTEDPQILGHQAALVSVGRRVSPRV